jgi:hypothetical protein
MKTKFNDIEISIDDEKYVVNYSFATPKQKEELEALSKADAEAVETYHKLNNEYRILEDKKTNNAELIPLLNGDEKLEVLKEQRELLTKIEKLAPKVKKAAEIEMNEETSIKRYEMLVSGIDKDRLKEDANKHSIPLSIVMQEISAGVIKAKEKK